MELSKVLLDSLFIKVLTKALSEPTNYSLTTLINFLALVYFRIEAISSVVLESIRAGGSSSWRDKSSYMHPNVKNTFSFYSKKLLPFSIGTISIKVEGITKIIKETKNYFI